MGLLSFLFESESQLPDPQWRRDPKGGYGRLKNFSTADLKGVGGVYVLWHSGGQSQWVYVGATGDMARALERAREDDDISEYEVGSGLFVTWSPIAPKFRTGVAAYLMAELHPRITEARPGDDRSAGAKPVPVMLPA